jgi:hypothetical protein
LFENADSGAGFSERRVPGLAARRSIQIFVPSRPPETPEICPSESMNVPETMPPGVI